MVARIDKGHSTPSNSPLFDVVVVDLAKREGRNLLTDVEYAHMVSIEKRLVHWGNLDEIGDLSFDKVSDNIWELREKGGPLRKKNMRVFFAVVGERKEIVILKTYKKEEDHQTPRHVVIVAEDRLDEYLAGHLESRKSVYVPSAAQGRR